MKQKIVITAIVTLVFSISACGYSDGYEYENDYYEEQEPYSGYNDGIDQDCADIGRKVYVGSYDPDGLDRDGDGWGCESYGD